MSQDAQKPAQPPQEAGAAATAPVAPPSPELLLKAKLEELQNEAKALEAEVKILDGRMKNRDPKLAALAQKENEALKSRITLLQKITGYLLTQIQTQSHSEAQGIFDADLKASALDYFKKANIKEELWKNLVS